MNLSLEIIAIAVKPSIIFFQETRSNTYISKVNIVLNGTQTIHENLQDKVP